MYRVELSIVGEDRLKIQKKEGRRRTKERAKRRGYLCLPENEPWLYSSGNPMTTLDFLQGDPPQSTGCRLCFPTFLIKYYSVQSYILRHTSPGFNLLSSAPFSNSSNQFSDNSYGCLRMPLSTLRAVSAPLSP